ncbi:MAG: copper homeostasis protein CutC [Flavobacteriaceae bacterium]|nr:copper homeostasis protein CutC [Flavobacteriaceae bacterium]
MIVEICVDSLASAITAQEAGADRIELCAALGVGGITPSYGLIKQVVATLDIPVYVLIRARTGDFVYAESEVSQMCTDIQLCKELGVAGVVCGALTSDFAIHQVHTQRFLEAASGMDFTFHRAFDWVADAELAYDVLAALGAPRILSSGLQPKAIKGIHLLQSLQQKGKISIMPGSGVHAQNIMAFKEAGFEEIHFSATVFSPNGYAQASIPFVSDSFLDASQTYQADANTIKACIGLLQ